MKNCVFEIVRANSLTKEVREYCNAVSVTDQRLFLSYRTSFSLGSRLFQPTSMSLILALPYKSVGSRFVDYGG